LLEIELLSGNGPRTRRCKAIGIDKEEEEEEEEECAKVYFYETLNHSQS
jgi:hypothetical protein